MKNNQLNTMLSMQAAMNAKINPSWLAAGYPYLRAAVIEGAEAIEHHGWKWWKAQSMDLPQLQMELVDIWHFALSHFLIKAGGDIGQALGLIQVGATADGVSFDGIEFNPATMDTLAKLELMTGMATMRKFAVNLFLSLLNDCQLSPEDLFRQYVCKNVLNFFRQDHGYKEGTYRKIWAGREDNEHLVEIASELDVGMDNFSQQLYDQLTQRYNTTKA